MAASQPIQQPQCYYEWYSFGSNASGLLLHHNYEDSHIPVKSKFILKNESISNNQESTEGKELQELNHCDILQLSCSGMHTSILTNKSELYLSGELNNTNNCRLIKFNNQLIDNNNVKYIATGWTNTVIMVNNNLVYALDNNNITNPIKLHWNESIASNNIVIKSISCGYKHILLLDNNGCLYGYGNNKYGQLGIGDNNNYNTITKINVKTIDNECVSHKIIQVQCGWEFSIILSDIGNVYTTGINKHKQLGLRENNDVKSINQWNQVHNLTNHNAKIVQIACGWSHCLALNNKRKVFGWGRSDRGQIGQQFVSASHSNDNTNSESKLQQAKRINAPASVCDDLSVSSVYCGSEHSILIDSKRCSVFFCGWNEHGNGGLNHTNNIFAPQEITSLRIDTTNNDNNDLGTEHNYLVSTGGAAVFVGKRMPKQQ